MGLSDPQISGPPDAAVAWVAASQHGVVSRWQLRQAGVTDTMIRGRVRRGLLLRLHRGVYAVGHKRLRRQGFALAAVLAVGDRAVLSHRDAGWLHGVLRSDHARVDVTTPGRPAPHAGIRIHARRVLDPQDITRVEGIPVTTIARTLVDLADVLPAHRLAKALSESERQRLLDMDAIAGALERARGRNGRGHGALTAALDELDGYEFHRHRKAWENDHEKTNALKDLGYDVRRYTYGDVLYEPRRTAARLTRALGA